MGYEINIRFNKHLLKEWEKELENTTNKEKRKNIENGIEYLRWEIENDEEDFAKYKKATE